LKKKEATRIDQENYKFAQRIMSQKPQVDKFSVLHAKHKQNLKTVHMISNQSGISINRIVEKNASRFAGIQGPLGSTHRLPPLRSPSNSNFNEAGGAGELNMPKKIIVTSSSRRTKSLIRQRAAPPSQQYTHSFN